MADRPDETTKRPGLLDALAYLATDLPLGIVAFTLVVTGLALTVGLAVTAVLAIPAAWLTIWSARGLATVERWRLWAFLDRDVPPPKRATGSGLIGALRAAASDRMTRREAAHALLHLPASCLTFTLLSVFAAVPLTLVAVPILVRTLPSRTVDLWVTEVRSGAGVWGLTVLGLVMIPAAIWAIRALARLRARMSLALLTPGPEDLLRQRVERLETTRSQTVDAAEQERRRIERDLHDGAQQRIVALAMDLGMAREKLASDPEGAKALIAGAHDEAKRALVELRDLARGIHPAVLTDRGLSAALESVAARSPVPVVLDVDVKRRPPAAIEGIAYFVVSEALANVAKHAQATTAHVAVALHGGRLVVEITDDGVGGADPSRGTGLTGLAERVGAVDGWMHVTSPAGGPTTLTVELPCAS